MTEQGKVGDSRRVEVGQVHECEVAMGGLVCLQVPRELEREAIGLALLASRECRAGWKGREL